MGARSYLSWLIWVVATGGVWLWQWLDYQAHTRTHAQSFVTFGNGMLDAAEGAMVRACRGGSYEPEDLHQTLDEVRARIGALYLAATAPDGSILAASGTPGPPDQEGERFSRFTRTFEPPTPRGRGRGRGRGQERSGDKPLPAGALLLRLDLPRDRLTQAIASDRARFLVTAAALSLMAAAVLLFLVARLRSARLREHLAASRERVEALEYLGRLGAGLAHETKNPLSVVRGFAQQLRRGGASAEEVSDIASRMLEETDRTVARLDEFLLLSRPAKLRRARFDLRALLVELSSLVSPELQEKTASIEVTGPALETDADEEQVRRLFLNLLLNAVEAIGIGGHLWLRLAPRNGAAVVSVEDDGPGVPEEIRATLFEPYVTGRGGTGLGLSIARRIALEHGWTLTHEPRTGGGTCMRVETASDG